MTNKFVETFYVARQSRILKKAEQKHHKPLLHACVPDAFEVSPALVGHFVFSMWV